MLWTLFDQLLRNSVVFENVVHFPGYIKYTLVLFNVSTKYYSLWNISFVVENQPNIFVYVMLRIIKRYYFMNICDITFPSPLTTSLGNVTNSLAAPSLDKIQINWNFSYVGDVKYLVMYLQRVFAICIQRLRTFGCALRDWWRNLPGCLSCLPVARTATFQVSVADRPTHEPPEWWGWKYNNIDLC